MINKAAIEKDLTYSVTHGLDDIGLLRGDHETRTVKLSVRYTFDHAFDGAVLPAQEGEIMAAMRREAAAEHIDDVLGQARRASTPTRTIDMSAGVAGISINQLLLTQLDALSADSFAIISPMWLTLAQADTSEIKFTRREVEHYSDYDCIGYIGGHKVLVDPYGRDHTAAIVARTGWAKYNHERGISTTGVMIDPNTLNPVMSYVSDITCTNDPDRYTTIGITGLGMGCCW